MMKLAYGSRRLGLVTGPKQCPQYRYDAKCDGVC